MAFETWSEFFAMGKYGVYVWTCIVATVGLLGFNAITGYTQFKSLKKKIRMEWENEA